MIKALALSVLALAACHKAAAQQADDPCVDVLTRAKACTNVYIPALVDARARHDWPAGIADAVKQDRDGVIAQAMQEWATDSQPDHIAQACSAHAVSADDAEAARACLAKSDCGEFTACFMPIFEKHFAK